MTTVAIEKKRKNIDIPLDTFQKLSIMAASQGKSLKAFIESVLVAKADTLRIEIKNPSPSSDEYFNNSANLAEAEKRAKEHREGTAGEPITLSSAEDIAKFIISKKQ